MSKKIDSTDFQVRPGKEFKLSERPTKVKPIFKSKKHYHKRLDEGVEELSELQRMHYASNRHAILLIFQAMDAAGILDTVKELGMSYPTVSKARVTELQAIRKEL